jgi:hypothetical protein
MFSGASRKASQLSTDHCDGCCAARTHTQTLLPVTLVLSLWSTLRVVTVNNVHGEGRSVDLRKGSYLVDPASSHMLVSKIKPCMSKYKLLIL